MADIGTKIVVKRAKQYINTVTKEPYIDIANLILAFGEFLYLEDLKYLLIGDGSQTVKTLIENTNFYAMVSNTTLTNDAFYTVDIPLDETSVYRISNVKYVQESIVDLRDKLISGLQGSTTHPNVAKTISAVTWNPTTSSFDVTYQDISIKSNQITDLSSTLDDRINKLQINKSFTSIAANQTLSNLDETDGIVSASVQSISIPHTQVNDWDHTISQTLSTLKMTSVQPAANKTIQTIAETDGKISVTTQNISIPHSQVNDWNSVISDTLSKLKQNTIKLAQTDTIQEISETNGIISVKTQPIKISASQISDLSTTTVKTAATANIATTCTVTDANNDSNVFYIIGAKSGTTATNKNLYWANSTPAATINKQGIRFQGSTGVLMGAAWNDYAEYRRCTEAPGIVVCEVGDGSLIKSEEHLQKGAAVVSDTYGIVIGIDDDYSVPIAVSGRVLVYYSGDISQYEAGDAVCAGKDGLIEPMTRQEIQEYPERILGIVSEIPRYKYWNDYVSTYGRIWIKVK